jgi:hypothetical protein
MIENLKIYQELLADANMQLGLLRLPNSFREFEETMKKVARERLEALYVEDPNKVIFNNF